MYGRGASVEPADVLAAVTDEGTGGGTGYKGRVGVDTAAERASRRGLFAALGPLMPVPRRPR
jgi:hypothetical protein